MQISLIPCWCILFGLLILGLRAQEEEFSDCDPLVEAACLLPFPSNFYLKPSNVTATGYLLRITETSLPLSDAGEPINPADWLHRDGFGRLLPLATFFPGISLDRSSLPRSWDIAQSLRQGAPSILLDTVTGEALPHWCEMDFSTPTATPDRQMLFMWPTKGLEFGRRYIVAYQNLVDESGILIPVTDAFMRLRDGIPSKNNDIEGRRELYEDDIFPRLERAGFSRKLLQIAWDFTVASETNTRDPLRHMINDGISRLPAGGPTYLILSVQDDMSEYTGRYILGQYRVPLYLEENAPGSKLVFGPDQMPEFQGWGWAPFSVTIPTSITKEGAEPRGVLQYGHGLFQNHLVVLTPELQRASYLGQSVLYATNMVGMSAQDVPAVAEMLATDLSDASIIPHGCMQGVLNHLILTKMVMGDFAQDERVIFWNRSAINLNTHSYIGYSLGGIYGSTIVSLSEDIDRGVFGVPGGPFVMLLPRSRPFITYWNIICSRYSNPIDRSNLLAYMQIIWDHVEGISYADYLNRDIKKKGQYVWAKGDSQVTYLGNDILARTANAKTFSNIVTARDNETQFGFEVIQGTEISEGHITIGYEFWVDDVPIYNFPPDAEHFDTHNEVYKQDTFVYRSLSILLDGIHYQQCSGICTYD